MEKLQEFNTFLVSNSFHIFKIETNEANSAFEAVMNDVNLHFNHNYSSSEILTRITSNQPELALYLYRLGRNIYLKDNNDVRISYLHGLMRNFCSCEIYFNTSIDEGFYISHGIGTVIGSRNRIGKNFRIHQNCTIGHKKNGMGSKSGDGAIIGDNVIMYAKSSIIGELSIGTDVVIGIGQILSKDLPSNTIVK
jgi:serine O-acetyltransferase